MYRKVDSWIDAVALEHQIQAFWKENDSFKKLVEKNKGKPAWSFLDGPITANNRWAFTHAWGRTLKDFFQRYWAMNGRELRYQNGFDCQGLWVEVEVEKEHASPARRKLKTTAWTASSRNARRACASSAAFRRNSPSAGLLDGLGQQLHSP
jgi:isoleucyl-tRNA synthetase